MFVMELGGVWRGECAILGGQSRFFFRVGKQNGRLTSLTPAFRWKWRWGMVWDIVLSRCRCKLGGEGGLDVDDWFLFLFLFFPFLYSQSLSRKNISLHHSVAANKLYISSIDFLKMLGSRIYT